MSFLLDTSICVAFLGGRDEAVRDRLLALPPLDLRLCSVVKAELLFGARNSARVSENLSRLQRFFAPFTSLPFDDDAASRYGTIRTQLGREGRLLGANALMIAATALTADVTLATRNQDLRRVAGLKLAAW
jgi:tRNA(fMet)-specific endonuclease VapC